VYATPVSLIVSVSANFLYNMFFLTRTKKLKPNTTEEKMPLVSNATNTTNSSSGNLVSSTLRKVI